MNTIFMIAFGCILLVTLPSLYFIYKLATAKTMMPNSDVGQIRFLKEMETIEGMNGSSNHK